MDKTATSRPKGPSPLVLAIYMPIVLTVAFFANRFVWEAKGYAPAYLLAEKSSTTLAVECAGLASIPLILSIVVVMMFRMFTPAGDTLANAESPVMKIQSNVIQNNLESTFIFVLNLLACSTYKEFPQERLLGVTALFLAARFLFWLGYNLGYAVKFPPLRGPGFATTLALNFLLLAYNVNGFFKLQLF